MVVFIFWAKITSPSFFFSCCILHCNHRCRPTRAPPWIPTLPWWGSPPASPPLLMPPCWQESQSMSCQKTQSGSSQEISTWFAASDTTWHVWITLSCTGGSVSPRVSQGFSGLRKNLSYLKLLWRSRFSSIVWNQFELNRNYISSACSPSCIFRFLAGFLDALRKCSSSVRKWIRKIQTGKNIHMQALLKDSGDFPKQYLWPLNHVS